MIMKTTIRFGAVALVAALAACSPKTDDAANAAANAVTDLGSDMSNTTGNALEAAGDVLAPTPNGQGFADTAAKSDAFEIAAAKLALTNAASPDVKAFATKMIAAHTGSTVKIKAAAAKASPAITPDATLTSDQQGKLDDLAKLKGADFDAAYIDGQIGAHEDALALMKDYATNGDTPSLKTAAGEITPVVQGHLDMAKALKKWRLCSLQTRQ